MVGRRRGAARGGDPTDPPSVSSRGAASTSPGKTPLLLTGREGVVDCVLEDLAAQLRVHGVARVVRDAQHDLRSGGGRRAAPGAQTRGLAAAGQRPPHIAAAAAQQAEARAVAGGEQGRGRGDSTRAARPASCEAPRRRPPTASSSPAGWTASGGTGSGGTPWPRLLVGAGRQAGRRAAVGRLPGREAGRRRRPADQPSTKKRLGFFTHRRRSEPSPPGLPAPRPCSPPPRARRSSPRRAADAWRELEEAGGRLVLSSRGRAPAEVPGRGENAGAKQSTAGRQAALKKNQRRAKQASLTCRSPASHHPPSPPPPCCPGP